MEQGWTTPMNTPIAERELHTAALKAHCKCIAMFFWGKNMFLDLAQILTPGSLCLLCSSPEPPTTPSVSRVEILPFTSSSLTPWQGLWKTHCSRILSSFFSLLPAYRMLRGHFYTTYNLSAFQSRLAGSACQYNFLKDAVGRGGFHVFDSNQGHLLKTTSIILFETHLSF